jgi:hypothetical protein
MPKFLSVGEVALLLGKSERWTYNRIAELPGSFKLGGSWLIDQDVLIEGLKALALRKGKGRVSEDKHGL